MCQGSGKREFGITFCLVINGFVHFFTSSMSDIIGRRDSFRLSTILVLFGIILVKFSSNFYLKMFFLGICVGGDTVFGSNAIVLMNESTSKLDLF